MLIHNKVHCDTCIHKRVCKHKDTVLPDDAAINSNRNELPYLFELEIKCTAYNVDTSTLTIDGRRFNISI